MKILLTAVCFITTYAVFSQNNSVEESELDPQSFGNNELNINILYTAFKAVEMNYERFFDEDLSAGIAANYWFGDAADWDFSVLAYGRFYPFSEKANNALFIEMNAGVYNAYAESESETGFFIVYDEGQPRTAFGMGFAIGAKFYSRKGYTFNFYGGLNRNFMEDQYPVVIPRVGINVGKRF